MALVDVVTHFIAGMCVVVVVGVVSRPHVCEQVDIKRGQLQETRVLNQNTKCATTTSLKALRAGFHGVG